MTAHPSLNWRRRLQLACENANAALASGDVQTYRRLRLVALQNAAFGRRYREGTRA